MSTDKEKYDALRRVHVSTNLAVDVLEKDNTKLRDELNSSMERMVNCQDALNISKETLYTSITNHNEKERVLSEEIMRLKAEVKELEGR